VFSSAGDARPPTAFSPGPLFKEVTRFPESSAVSKEFNASSLEGKQIWYISAPAEVPLAELETISLENAKLGNALLTHNSSKYGFVADDENSKKNLYVSMPGRNGYNFSKAPPSSLMLRLTTAVPAKVQQVYHVQQITDKDRAVTATSTQGKKRKREQPKGMRIRYKLAGFTSGDPGAMGDSESDDPESTGAGAEQEGITTTSSSKRTQFKAPSAVSTVPIVPTETTKSKKRKSRDEEPTVEQSSKKSKKNKAPELTKTSTEDPKVSKDKSGTNEGSSQKESREKAESKSKSKSKDSNDKGSGKEKKSKSKGKDNEFSEKNDKSLAGNIEPKEKKESEKKKSSSKHKSEDKDKEKDRKKHKKSTESKA
jgi:hypothetical protein